MTIGTARHPLETVTLPMLVKDMRVVGPRLGVAPALIVFAGCGLFGDDDVSGGGTGGNGGAGGNPGACSPGTAIDATAPELMSSDPQPDATVSWTSWLTVRFAETVDEAVLPAFALLCDEACIPTSAHRLLEEPDTVVVNPAQDLPFEARCELHWPGPSGLERLSFPVLGSLPEALVPYDRSDPARYAPFPDDVWLTPDPSAATGGRLELPVPTREPDVRFVLERLNRTAGSPDGFSPIGGLVVELSDAPDPTSLPLTPTASLDPLATVGLFDLDPASSSYRRRIPFKLRIRSLRTATTPVQHVLVMHPSIPLSPGGSYGLVVTRRALAAAGQPYDPSPFTAAALGDETTQGALGEVRPLIDEVMTTLSTASPPLFDDDVALVIRFTVRSTAQFPLTPLTMKQHVLDGSAPAFTIVDIRAGTGDVAAYVDGTWEALEWRDGDNISRDGTGRPVVVGTKEIPFILAIPKRAELEPVPIVMAQHGNPSTAEDVVRAQAESHLAENQFAVIGFSDTIVREIGPDIEAQVRAMLEDGIVNGALPDYWIQTTGEQLSFLRLIEQLGTLDIVPLGTGGDQQPDVDVTLPISYVGISEGGNKGQALVPYAPEIRAAALVTAGARLGEILFVQDEIGPDGVGTRNLGALQQLAPNARPLDLFVGLSVFQIAFDPQDPQNHAAFVYADPREVAGTFQKPSVLVQEGIADPLIPNNATRSLAYTLGPIPQLEPVVEAVPHLVQVTGPLTGNVDVETTAAHSQYVPAGVPGLEVTPGCENEPNGHACAQNAPSARAQRVEFFRSAVEDAVPTIGP